MHGPRLFSEIDGKILVFSNAGLVGRAFAVANLHFCTMETAREIMEPWPRPFHLIQGIPQLPLAPLRDASLSDPNTHLQSTFSPTHKPREREN